MQLGLVLLQQSQNFGHTICILFPSLISCLEQACTIVPPQWYYLMHRHCNRISNEICKVALKSFDVYSSLLPIKYGIIVLYGQYVIMCNITLKIRQRFPLNDELLKQPVVKRGFVAQTMMCSYHFGQEEVWKNLCMHDPMIHPPQKYPRIWANGAHNLVFDEAAPMRPHSWGDGRINNPRKYRMSLLEHERRR